MNFLDNINSIILQIIGLLGPYGMLFNCIAIIIESIVPILPLSLFITIIFINYGNILGFIISWICTIIGCMVSFIFFQTIFKNIVDKKFRKNEKVEKLLKVIDDINFKNLVILIAIPFTPAFLVNIAAGISKINLKKYFFAIIIGKISLVWFWGYIGVSLVESLKNPIILIKVAFVVAVTYLISIIVNRKLKI